MLEVIENCCSSSYLDTLFQSAISCDNWHMRYPHNTPFDDKHLKIDVLVNEVDQNVKRSFLAGISMGLLVQIYDKRDDLFLPQCLYCGVSMKDKHRLDNTHTDHENEPEFIKVFGLLNRDWDSKDGGSFLHGDKVIPMKPKTFVVFDPRIPHSASEIFTDKKRVGIDFTVKKK
jgi:hypothetical protein